MNLVRHRIFQRHFKIRVSPHKNLVRKFEERLALFLKSPNEPILKDHKLTRNLNKFRSFSIGGDLRLVYRVKGNALELYDIGSHNQVC